MLEIIEKNWNEFWGYYFRIEDRHSISGIFEWDVKLVDFIEHVCKLPSGARILDLGCGGGDQAKLLAEKGYKIAGLDIVPSLIDYGREQFEKAGLTGTFTVGDMRQIDYSEEFDACLVLSGSFGFFGDREDGKILFSIKKALKVGGKVFIMFHLPNEFSCKPSKTWKEIKDGWILTETWFDTEISSYCTKTFIIKKDGTLILPKPEPGNYHGNETIRCYTVPEMKEMFKEAGLTYLSCYTSHDFSVPPNPLSPGAVRNIILGESRG